MRLLEELERLSILALPARQGPGRGRQGPLSLGDCSAPKAPVDGPLQQLEPLRLRLVNGRDEAVLWNEFLARYLAVRDRWIGWQDRPHRPLERVVRQARFLLFP